MSLIDDDISPRDPSAPFDFTPFVFLGWIAGDVRFDRAGNLKFTITVPLQYRDAAMGIWNANVSPLKIRIERWKGEDDNGDAG